MIAHNTDLREPVRIGVGDRIAQLVLVRLAALEPAVGRRSAAERARRGRVRVDRIRVGSAWCTSLRACASRPSCIAGRRCCSSGTARTGATTGSCPVAGSRAARSSRTRCGASCARSAISMTSTRSGPIALAETIAPVGSSSMRHIVHLIFEAPLPESIAHVASLDPAVAQPPPVRALGARRRRPAAAHPSLPEPLAAGRPVRAARAASGRPDVDYAETHPVSGASRCRASGAATCRVVAAAWGGVLAGFIPGIGLDLPILLGVLDRGRGRGRDPGRAERALATRGRGDRAARRCAPAHTGPARAPDAALGHPPRLGARRLPAASGSPWGTALSSARGLRWTFEVPDPALGVVRIDRGRDGFDIDVATARPDALVEALRADLDR